MLISIFLLLSSLLSIPCVHPGGKSEIIIDLCSLQNIAEKKDETFFKQEISDDATPFFSLLLECLNKDFGLVITPDLVAYFLTHYIGQQLLIDSSCDARKIRKTMNLFFREIVQESHSDLHRVLQCSLSPQPGSVKTKDQEALLTRDISLELKRLSRVKLVGQSISWQMLYAQVCILREKLPQFDEYLSDIKLFLEYIDDAYDDEDINEFFWQDLFSYDQKLSYAHGFLLRLIPGVQLAPVISDSSTYLVVEGGENIQLTSGVLSFTVSQGWITPNLSYRLERK